VPRRLSVRLPIPYCCELGIEREYVYVVFADCALGRTFTAPFKCRAQNRAMNTCMIAHATQDEQDSAREEWFALRLRRQKERELKEERRREQEKFHREWWGLPMDEREGEKGRLLMQKAERVGGFPKRDEGQLSKDRHR
jgi:COX assembly protein 1